MGEPKLEMKSGLEQKIAQYKKLKKEYDIALAFYWNPIIKIPSGTPEAGEAFDRMREMGLRVEELAKEIGEEAVTKVEAELKTEST